ncbi:GntR family transcriptional regulator [Roseivivax isoporae]|uniref:GntR family transcriptional regulator n=1 Tax=Roseivivax isoporae LMG 25204 TaxID=1449351 RepID=X7F1W1_9RHOB|nr:GntR family transcriptional regulator [Roseivivax isoporae]ETX26902.1 GntR family transcriptional regulator [Roseivivax isoporae LMG 25204]
MHDPDPAFGPLARDGLVDRVAGLMAEAIVAGRVLPGARLSESTIARDLGVSRAPVREAARLLENSGLVRYRPNRGFFVRTLSSAALDNLYEFRIVIESAAIARLVARGDVEALLPRLDAQIAELYRVAEAGDDMLRQVEADMAFHRLICEGSGNPRYLAAFDQIANETKLGLMLIGRLYDSPRRMAGSHVPIRAAIAARDAQGATAAIEDHIGSARHMVTERFRSLEEGHPA